MEAPDGAHSTGLKKLTSQPSHLVSNLTSVRQSGMAINYEATATVNVSADNFFVVTEENRVPEFPGDVT